MSVPTQPLLLQLAADPSVFVQSGVVVVPSRKHGSSTSHVTLQEPEPSASKVALPTQLPGLLQFCSDPSSLVHQALPLGSPPW